MTADFDWMESLKPEQSQGRIDDEPTPLFNDAFQADASIDEPETVQVDRTFMAKPRRKPHAKEYENKIRGLLLVSTQMGLQSPNTVADACTIIVHGPKFAQTWGDLAAENDKIATAIDFLTKPSDSATTAAILATLPFALQLIRNHEPVAEAPRTIRIPIIKREFKIKFNVKLGRLRNMTLDPDELTNATLSIPEISAAINKWGLQVAQRARKRDSRTSG
jgi:hypothetical protein